MLTPTQYPNNTDLKAEEEEELYKRGEEEKEEEEEEELGEPLSISGLEEAL